MIITKHTVTVTVEVTDTASVPALLQDVINQFEREAGEGNLSYRDGDTVTWTHKQDEAIKI